MFKKTVQQEPTKTWEFNFTNDFCEFIFSERCKGYTFIAHNDKAFDDYFVLKYCVSLGIVPYTIKNVGDFKELTTLYIHAGKKKI